MSKLDVAIFDLSNALAEEGVKLEFIKIDKPISHNNKTVNSIGWVEIKTVVYEDDATAWRSAPDNTPQPPKEDTDELTDEQRAEIDEAVHTAVDKYGETFKRLGDTDGLREKILAIDTTYVIGKNHTQEFILPEFYLQRLVSFIDSYALQRSREAEIAAVERLRERIHNTVHLLSATQNDDEAINAIDYEFELELDELTKKREERV